MSKLYMMNRMQYGAAAGGGFLGALLPLGAKLLGLGKKAAPAVAKVIKTPVGKQVATGVAAGAGWAVGEKLLRGAGPEGRGASGGWGYRRRRGITATELRGFRKVANLIHKEGMVSKRARGRKVC